MGCDTCTPRSGYSCSRCANSALRMDFRKKKIDQVGLCTCEQLKIYCHETQNHEEGIKYDAQTHTFSLKGLWEDIIMFCPYCGKVLPTQFVIPNYQ